MKLVNICFKLSSILSIIFFVALYLFYVIIKVRDLKETDVSYMRNIAGDLMATSFYAIGICLIVMILSLFKKYKISKAYIAVWMISILSWVIVLYIDPGGIYNWFFD